MKAVALGALVSLLAAAACDTATTRPVRIEGATMGTSYTVQVLDLPPALETAALRTRVAHLLASIQGKMSTYDPDSELSRFNASDETAWFPVSADTHAVVAAALDVHARTRGAFDVTVAPLVDLWGFGPAGERRRPEPAAIVATLDRVGSAHLEARADPPAIRKARPDVRVDLSAIAKGFAVDEVARALEEAGARRYLVEIGGELRARGTNAVGRPWRVAVERPRFDRSVPPCVLELSDVAVATSGDYRNAFVEEDVHYSHVLDPRTGRPVTTGVVSATVLAPTAVDADALATALMVLGPEEGLALATSHGLAARLLVRVDGELLERRTRGFPGGTP